MKKNNLNRFLVLLTAFSGFCSQVFGLGFNGGITSQQPGDQASVASPTLTSTTTNFLTITNPQDNDFNLTIDPLFPGYNSIQTYGSAYSNASPTANMFYIWNATDSLYIPGNLTVGGGITYEMVGNDILLTAQAGVNTVTASPTALDTAEIDMTVSGTNQVSGVLIDNSIAESRLSILSVPTPGFFLTYQPGGMDWVQHFDTITASPTALDTSEIDMTVNPVTHQVSADILANSIAESKLSISNGPAADQYLKYVGGQMTWVTGPSTNSTLGSIDFETIAPADINPGSTDASRHTVTLTNASTQGALFGAKRLPDDWNGSSDLVFSFLVATPDAPAASPVVVQVQYQIIKAGNPLYSSSGFTTVGTFTKTLSNTSNAQSLTDAGFLIPSGSLAAGDRIHVVIQRDPDEAGDTHADTLHIVGLTGTFTK